MSKKSQLEKNLSNPELTGQLLSQAIVTVNILKESLWKEGTSCECLPTLKAATILLEKSIDAVMPNSEQEDKNQLKLEL